MSMEVFNHEDINNVSINYRRLETNCENPLVTLEVMFCQHQCSVDAPGEKRKTNGQGVSELAKP